VPLNWIAVKKDDELRRRMREGEDRAASAVKGPGRPISISGRCECCAGYQAGPESLARDLRELPSQRTRGEEGAARKRSFAGAARRIAAPADAPNRADPVNRNATKATLLEHAGIHAGMRSAESASLGSQSV